MTTMFKFTKATNPAHENIQAFGPENLNITKSKLYLAAAGLAIASAAVDLKEHSSPAYVALDVAAAAAWTAYSISRFRENNSANTPEA